MNIIVLSGDLERLQYPGVFPRELVSVHGWLLQALEGQAPAPLPFIPAVNTNMHNVVSVCTLLSHDVLDTVETVVLHT